MQRSLVALALALPMVSIVGAIVHSELRRAQAEDWTFTTRGYDPRDLFYGHYVRFNIDFRESAPRLTCTNHQPDCCLCLSGKPGPDIPHTRRMSCDEARSSCDGVLQTRFIERLDRYYVPEGRARELDERVRQASRDGNLRAVLSIDPTGYAEVNELRIGGKRVE